MQFCEHAVGHVKIFLGPPTDINSEWSACLKAFVWGALISQKFTAGDAFGPGLSLWHSQPLLGWVALSDASCFIICRGLDMCTIGSC